MVIKLLRALRAHAARLIGAAALTALAVSPAAAREFQRVDIKLNLQTGVFDAFVVSDDYTGPINEPTLIRDGVFTKLSLEVTMPTQAISTGLQRQQESAFTVEASGCEPGRYGPLDMEDGLRYFFEVDTPQGKVLASFYPGNRSTHWHNDAFCDFDNAVGPNGAVFVLTGYYYVVYRTVDGDVPYIQLRAVTLTQAETDALEGALLTFEDPRPQ